ncbi:MAG TPA: nuclear transport factor 2 family protein, partial [Burkholderiaceae bacterium]|nr:nuclear transport factor 2 family protein [Burkholderiaceae bacterium]
ASRNTIFIRPAFDAARRAILIGEGPRMQTNLQDRMDIADLMTGWIHRDLAQWDDLRTLFHPDGEIEVTWFEGKASDFVDASMRMGASDLRTKHLITSPVVAFNGCKAVVETNVVIIGENLRLGLGCAGHSRFYDLVEKRGGVWKIVMRQCIYDMGSFTFPIGIVDIDKAIVARYPSAYAPLAYLLEKSGFPVRRVFATKGSDLEVQMKKGGQAWRAMIVYDVEGTAHRYCRWFAVTVTVSCPPSRTPTKINWHRHLPPKRKVSLARPTTPRPVGRGIHDNYESGPG